MTAQNVYIAGSGHSGSTLLDRLLGGHPQIAALGEIHRLSLGLHRTEGPFRCDCGTAIADCPFWQDVLARLAQTRGISPRDLAGQLRTTDHGMLEQASGERYFNAKARYAIVPRRLDKIAMGLAPGWAIPALDRMGLLGEQLAWARDSLDLFDAVRHVTGRMTVVDSTKNPLRLRSLYLAGADRPSAALKVIYLRRDGRAVAASRMRRQGVSMRRAARIWVAENRKAEIVLGRMPDVPVLGIAYEDLCTQPETELAHLHDFLGLPPAPMDLGAVRHAVGGNPSRHDAGRESITLDERWRTTLSSADLDAFDQVAGGFVPGPARLARAAG